MELQTGFSRQIIQKLISWENNGGNVLELKLGAMMKRQETDAR
jgi:hypothetical protein